MRKKTSQADYPIHDLVSDRWSPYVFAPRSVSSQHVRSLFEAARWAPSSYNEQPWRWIIAGRNDELGFQKILNCLVPGNQAWAKHAGVLGISVANMTFARNGHPNAYGWHDVGLAMGNLCLQATALGLSVHQMGGFDRDAARSTLGIPEGYDPVAAFAIGYHGDDQDADPQLVERDQSPRKRRPIHESVFGVDWGQAAQALDV